MEARAESQDGAENSIELVRVSDRRQPGDEGTCLRPLGLCELGGACDACWYSPDHPRFKDRNTP
jgi:hypothetical protein